MNKDEKQIVLTCATLLEVALGPGLSVAKSDEIVRSVAKMLRAV